MTDIEKVQKIREITLSPFKKISEALKTTNGDVDKAIELLKTQKEASAADMQNRVSNAGLVYSYVHQGRIGAMIVLASQTDFAAKNPLFEELAKNICFHIVSSNALYIDEDAVPEPIIQELKYYYSKAILNKPQNIAEKIVEGKLAKYFSEVCLLNQRYVKDDSITIKQLIAQTSATLGERIVVKQFIKMKNDVG